MDEHPRPGEDADPDEPRGPAHGHAANPLPPVVLPGVFTDDAALLEEREAAATTGEEGSADAAAGTTPADGEDPDALAALADELGILRGRPDAQTASGDEGPRRPHVPEAFVPRTPDARRQKALLRARMRQERDVIPSADHARGSETVCRKVLGLPCVTEGATVALYRPLGSELALAPLVRAAAGTLRLLAPVTLAEGRMEFVQVTSAELLARRKDQPAFLARPGRALDALPQGRPAVGVEELDVMLVPGVAFDRTCRRLGYGGGYYDAYLARKGLRALVVGLAFDEQITPRLLPAEEHDRRMDGVLTPTEEIWA